MADPIIIAAAGAWRFKVTSTNNLAAAWVASAYALSEMHQNERRREKRRRERKNRRQERRSRAQKVVMRYASRGAIEYWIDDVEREKR